MQPIPGRMIGQTLWWGDTGDVIRYWAAVAWAYVRWAWHCAGYWVRPYDMLADARRWRWQPRQRCGWSQCGWR